MQNKHTDRARKRARAAAAEQNGQQKARHDASPPPQDEYTNDPASWLPPIPLSTMPAVEPFPIDVLPGVLADFVKCVAATLSCPHDYVAVPLLALAGGAIGASRCLKLKEGWTERPAIYASVIGKPGTAKSPALKTVAAPVYAEQNRLKGVWDRRMEIYEQEVAAFESAKRSRKGKEPEESASKPRKPTLNRVVASDATVEAMAPVLLANPRGLSIVRDELTGWVASMNAYRGGKGADRQFFLSGWAGEALVIDRKQQDGAALIVPHPFFSIIGGLPPDMAAGLRDEQNRSDGFLDRVLFAFPDPGPAAGHNDYHIPADAAGNWRDVLTYLWALKMEPGEDDSVRPHVVQLTSEGRRRWNQFLDDHAAEMNADSFAEHLEGPWSKLKGYCARLALIVHHLRLATGETFDEDVDEKSVERAVRLTAYFKSQAMKVYHTIDCDPKLRDAGKVWAWIVREKRTEFRRWEAYEDLKSDSRFPTPDALDAPLGLMEQHHLIRQQQQPERRGSGRKPAPVYEVNPLATDPQQSGGRK